MKTLTAGYLIDQAHKRISTKTMIKKIEQYVYPRLVQSLAVSHAATPERHLSELISALEIIAEGQGYKIEYELDNSILIVPASTPLDMS